MNMRNTLVVIRKDILLGPRGAMFLWIVSFPLVITFLLRLVFGGLIDPSPRLGIYDEGASAISAEARALDGVEVRMVESRERLLAMVEADDLDAGLVLTRGFDDALRAGERPELRLYIGGESLASDRIVLSVSVVDLVRKTAGAPFPVEVKIDVVGDGTSVPIRDRLVPLMVLMAVALAGIFVPAASIVQERERKTLDAVLSTPLVVGELMAAKGVVGFLLAFVVGAATLVINSGLGAYAAGHLVVLAVASFMCVLFGLALGTTVKDMTTMFTVWKSGGIILFAPAILFLFPDLPRWVARIFPTYYFLGPLYDMIVEGAALRQVAPDLAIGMLISFALVVPVVALGRRMEMKLAAA